jgi:hypothetical protein
VTLRILVTIITAHGHHQPLPPLAAAAKVEHTRPATGVAVIERLAKGRP